MNQIVVFLAMSLVLLTACNQQQAPGDNPAIAVPEKTEVHAENTSTANITLPKNESLNEVPLSKQASKPVESPIIQTPNQSFDGLVIEADDIRFYPVFINVNKSDHVKLKFKVRNGVDSQGLRFTSEKLGFDSGEIKPGEDKIYEFDVNQSIIIKARDSITNTIKANFNVRVPSNDETIETNNNTAYSSGSPPQSPPSSPPPTPPPLQPVFESVVDERRPADPRTYTLLGKNYDVTVEFLVEQYPTATTRFTIGDETTPNLQIGGQATLQNNVRITFMAFTGLQIDRRVRFNLTVQG